MAIFNIAKEAPVCNICPDNKARPAVDGDSESLSPGIEWDDFVPASEDNSLNFVR